MQKSTLALAVALVLTSPLTAFAQNYTKNLPVLEPSSPQQRSTYDPYAPTNNNGNIRSFDVGVSRIAANTALPAITASNQDSQAPTLFMDPNEERPMSIFLSNDIYDSNNQLALPRGSEVRGRFVPVRGGLKFLADAVVVRGQYYAIQASSDVLRDEKDPRQYSGEAIAGDALIGAGAGALLGALTGGVSWGGVLGGAAASSILGNVTAPQVVVVSPDRPLNLRLDAPLTVRN
jgi:hypothetical protein